MEKLLKHVYSSDRLCILFKLLSHTATVASAAAFAFLSVVLCIKSPLLLLRLAIITGVPFIAVTLIRRTINAPRPYELYEFYSKPPKEKQGRSFPSRHAFSAFSIGTVMCFAYPLLGALVLAFGLGMCVARVLLGIHFIRDVLCGALIGAVSSLIGVLVLSPF